MPAPPNVTQSLELKQYFESQDHLVRGTPEPSSRSQALIYRFKDHKWWIKVTLLGTLYQSSETEAAQKIPKRERCREYQEFVNQINYRTLPLLDDTVSELVLENSPGMTNHIDLNVEARDSTNSLVIIAKSLSYRIQEDPLRVTYPSCCEFPSFRCIDWAALEEEDEIADGVHRVCSKTARVPYVLKVVNRPLYRPHDTNVIRKELENLERFKGVPGIVQPVAIAVSSNPYMTARTSDQPPVISGILLEFYSGGSLQRILKEDRVKEYPWTRWPIQIGTALSHFHRAGQTHMDIKPANVVLDAQGNAVLIDISGASGITYSWRAPEIRPERSPFDLPFQARLLHDVWAYGKVLSEIATRVGKCTLAETLLCIAGHLMEENPWSRMTLSEAISQLSGYGNFN
ncbi:protein kinase domain-containing protein [Aspergillus nomiae NRRL 13137]|uniref:Protein kinase domain-containing protein n=1 Tax=Aspergillus nomiae NRRL (strain ATCC 15546 / NRRL 13137 / CBS 260.88 / M93) TaxID=1509407 RepID=A0A0L1J710_ASPN3|nr:protein kinase domain-containing protein [Aspergillus nomiae NRRL 13137]KNG87606.1 protein kinase domain-containing protein [Aspergillus nomiae NRRL 13137]